MVRTPVGGVRWIQQQKNPASKVSILHTCLVNMHMVTLSLKCQWLPIMKMTMLLQCIKNHFGATGKNYAFGYWLVLQMQSISHEHNTGPDICFTFL